MPTTDDRLDLLGAMYNTEEDEAPEASDGDTAARKPERTTGILSMPVLSQMIRAQAQTIELQARALRRLTQRIQALERHGAQVSKGLNDLDREVGNKLDKRDWG